MARKGRARPASPRTAGRGPGRPGWAEAASPQGEGEGAELAALAALSQDEALPDTPPHPRFVRPMPPARGPLPARRGEGERHGPAELHRCRTIHLETV